MGMKKILIIVSIVLVIALIAFIAIIKIGLNDWMSGVTKEGDEIKRSSLGDEFLIEYETTTMPDLETSVLIKAAEKKEKIVYFVIHDKEYYQSDLMNIVDKPQIRCYQIYNQLLYKIGNESFAGISINDIEKTDPHEKPSFTQVAKALVETRDWKWIKTCGEFLLKAGDTDMKGTFERYAAGQFTSEEVEQNMNSEIKKEDIIDFAKRLLE